MIPERTVTKKKRWNPYGNRHMARAVVESSQSDKDSRIWYDASQALTAAADSIIRVIRDNARGSDIGSVGELGSVKRIAVEYASRVLDIAGCKGRPADGSDKGDGRFRAYAETTGHPGDYSPTREFALISKELDRSRDPESDEEISPDDIRKITGPISSIILQDITAEIAKRYDNPEYNQDSGLTGDFRAIMSDAAEKIARDISGKTDQGSPVIDRIQIYQLNDLTLEKIIKSYAGYIVNSTKAKSGDPESNRGAEEFGRYLTESGLDPQKESVRPGPDFMKFIEIRDKAIADIQADKKIDSDDPLIKAFGSICPFPELSYYLWTMVFGGNNGGFITDDTYQQNNSQKSKPRRLPLVASVYTAIAMHTHNAESYMRIADKIPESGDAPEGITDSQRILLDTANAITDTAASANIIDARKINNVIDSIYKEAPVVKSNVEMLPTAYSLYIDNTKLENAFSSIPDKIAENHILTNAQKKDIYDSLDRIAKSCNAYLQITLLLLNSDGANNERNAIYNAEQTSNLHILVYRIIHMQSIMHNNSISFSNSISSVFDPFHIKTANTDSKIRADIRRAAEMKLRKQIGAGAEHHDFSSPETDAPVSEFPEAVNSARNVISDIADSLAGHPAEKELRGILSDLELGTSAIRTVSGLSARIERVCALLGNGDTPEYRSEVNALRDIEQELSDAVDSRNANYSGMLDDANGSEEYRMNLQGEQD